jgi:hypothetical protein
VLELKTKQVAGGGRNVTYQIRGIVTEGDFPLTEIKVGKGLKLSSAVWVVQEKMGIQMWWIPTEPLLVMESRNSVRFETSLAPPEEWSGSLYINGFGFAGPPAHMKLFTIVLDFDR